MFFLLNVLCNSRLFKLKTEGQTIETDKLTEKVTKLKLSKFSLVLG